MRDPRDYTRYVMAKAVGAGDPMLALGYAKAHFGPDNATVKLLQKDAMASGNLGDDPDFRAAGRAFVEIVKARSLIGKIQAAVGFRTVPFHTPTLTQQAAPIASWVSEGGPIQLASGSFERTKLVDRKLAGIVVMTTELLKGAGATFESAVSRELVRGIAALEGSSFIDPANAGAAGVSPASITHGITPVAGTSNAAKDIAALLDAFQGDLETAVFITAPKAGVSLNAAGFLGAGALGGDIGGIPQVTSSTVQPGTVVLVDAAGVLLADDGVIMDTADQATLIDSDGKPLNLYMENLSAIKVVRHLNWEVARPGAVALLTGATW